MEDVVSLFGMSVMRSNDMLCCAARLDKTHPVFASASILRMLLV